MQVKRNGRDQFLARLLPAANAAFAGPIPRNCPIIWRGTRTLLPEFKKIWVDAGGKTSGTWEEVFGRTSRPPRAHAGERRLGVVPSPTTTR